MWATSVHAAATAARAPASAKQANVVDLDGVEESFSVPAVCVDPLIVSDVCDVGLSVDLSDLSVDLSIDLSDLFALPDLPDAELSRFGLSLSFLSLSISLSSAILAVSAKPSRPSPNHSMAVSAAAPRLVLAASNAASSKAASSANAAALAPSSGLARTRAKMAESGSTKAASAVFCSPSPFVFRLFAAVCRVCGDMVTGKAIDGAKVGRVFDVDVDVAVCAGLAVKVRVHVSTKNEGRRRKEELKRIEKN